MIRCAMEQGLANFDARYGCFTGGCRWFWRKMHGGRMPEGEGPFDVYNKMDAGLLPERAR